MLALSVQAQEIYTGAIAISPSVPTNSWRPTNTLAPGDSAKLSITVAQTGSDNGRNYTLHGNPIQHPPISSPPGSIIWRGNYSSLHACNAGNSPGTTTVTVTAKWVETGSGGGGSGGSPSIISGEATGIAQADIPVFSWSFDRPMQFADGTSPITYTVTGTIAGSPVSMSPYSVKALSSELSVTPDPLSSTNIRTGKITSINSAKSNMGVYYGERELARSDDEIAFGKVDLIVPQGPGTNGGTPLPEDRLTNGGTAPATNELNPGTIVLLLPQDQTNKVATTLTLKADPTGGSVTLDQHGLTDLKIYSDGALQEELTLPKTWTNGDTPPTTLYMVGSSTSTNLQSAQGTLDLTYKTTLAADGGEYSIKDTVGVTLVPFEISYDKAANSPHRPVFGKIDPYDPSEHQPMVPQDEQKPLKTENCLVIYHKDVRKLDGQPGEITDFDVNLKLAMGSLQWSKIDGPQSGQLVNPTSALAVYRNPKKGGVYKLNLEVFGKTTRGQIWLPKAGPDISEYWQKEIDYFRNTWGPAYRAKVNLKTLPLAATPSIWLIARAAIRLEDMSAIGINLDWKDPSGGMLRTATSPCGGPWGKSGEESRYTIKGYVIDFRKRNNMMYALIGREMGLYEWELRTGPNIARGGAPDGPEALEAYQAGFDIYNGVTVEDVMRSHGYKMQRNGTWTEREWPSDEATTDSLVRKAQQQLDDLIR
jgi:hypothetical protein